jgi:hypothetical protein
MEQAPERLALLEQLEGIVDVRERHLVRYEAIEIYLHLLRKKCKNIKLPFNQHTFGIFKGYNNDAVFNKENLPVCATARTTATLITYPIDALVHELRQLGLALEVTKYASGDPTALEKLHRVQRRHLRRCMDT